MLITALLFMCTDQIPDMDFRYGVGWGIIGMACFNILVNNVIMFHQAFVNLKKFIKKIKERCNKDKVKKYSTNTPIDPINTSIIGPGELF